MFFKIQSYSYDDDALRKLEKSGTLDVEVSHYIELTAHEYLAMRKSLQVVNAYLRKAKVSKIPAGARWITVHPNGDESEGQPILIQDTGNGTAHVIAGAGGKLNGLKLNKIKSKEEYAEEFERRKEAKKRERMEERLAEQKRLEEMTHEERKAYKEQKKAEKELARRLEEEKKKQAEQAQEEFIQHVANKMGWEIKRDYDEEKEHIIAELQARLADAEEKGDEAEIKNARKALMVAGKAIERAKKAQRKNLLSHAREVIRNIRREMIFDPSLREQIESMIQQQAHAEEEIKTENKNKGLGFQKEYRESASEHGLTQEELAEEKEKMFQDRLQEIAMENPGAAAMIAAGVGTSRAIADAKSTFYEPEDPDIKPISEIDTKAELLKKYLEMKQTLDNIEGNKEKATEINLDGTVDDADESAEDIVYGRGVSLDFSEALDAELESEAEAMAIERQAEIHSSLLETIKNNTGGSGKWIANGNYAGLNSIALAALKNEGLDRDVVDILGVGASAKLLAMMARRDLSKEEYEDFSVGMEKYHKEINEAIAKDATERAKELIARAESLQAEIDANPTDLAMVAELNETRLEYLDAANRIAGQALGNLEASAAMVLELKRKTDKDSIEVSLGQISNEDAIIRMRALGLAKDDYDIDTINGSKIATIHTPQKLLPTKSKEDIAIENRVSQIKAGLEDEDGWMPPGLVRRETDSFTDPGPDAEYAADSIENQSLADNADEIAKTEEAVHRTLGEMPEGRFVFKAVEDLTPEDQADLRRYWEKNIYKGSMAEQTATQDMQNIGGEAISRQGAWMQFLRGKCAGDKNIALELIRNDLIENHSFEDMFGEKDIPPLTKVVPGQWETYRGNVDGAEELFQQIDDLRDPDLVIDADAASREAEKLEKELPEKLTELYETQMRDHYLKFMSGYTEVQFEAGAEREEKSPWGEYVRMHGDVERAHAAVLDIAKGEFIEKFVKNYGRVTKKHLHTKVEKIRNWKDHVLGMLHKDVRDSFIDKVQAELASAGATVANRERGKFAAGSWKEKAIEYLEQKRKEDAAQLEMFGGEELKQNDGSEKISIGQRAEQQLASIVPQIAVNQRRGQKYAVASMNTKGERQRAIKMFEVAKRMNLTFGTGKGKTIISIASFTTLKDKGKAKRAIFAVPSVVQAQFGNEVNVFCKPGKYRVKSDPGLSREERIQALKDGNLDMVVMTHQSLRDDLIHIMARNNGLDDNAMKAKFNAMRPDERVKTLGDAMKKEGISFDMLTVDESHYTMNRKGKEDATLANVVDALNQNVEYFMNQSATPVKNDISEAYDMLHKVDPKKFNNRDEFMKKYGVDPEFSQRSLQRLIDRYNYASKTVTGTVRNDHKEEIDLTPEQKSEYDKVLQMFKQASKASKEGRVDVEAMKYLSPNSFRNVPEEKHEDIAKRLQESAGVIKEEALNRVVNQFDGDKNAKVQRLMDIVSSNVYQADNPKTNAHAGDRKPGVIFTHNLATLAMLRQSLEKKGVRVGVIQGSMNGAQKEEVKVGFNPPNPKDRVYDVIICSDAGATGLNLQNAAYLVNYDLPQTAWVKQQREGRIDRPGQAHSEIDYFDLVTKTPHEQAKWDRIQRKKALGSIFEEDPGILDDTGLASRIANVRQERYNKGLEVKGVAA